MKTKISYYVGCFDRYLEVVVSETDKENAEYVMDTAYDAWLTDPNIVVTDWCCEEYILHCLKENGIKFEWIQSEENADE